MSEPTKEQIELIEKWLPSLQAVGLTGHVKALRALLREREELRLEAAQTYKLKEIQEERAVNAEFALAEALREIEWLKVAFNIAGDHHVPGSCFVAFEEQQQQRDLVSPWPPLLRRLR